MMDLSNEIYIAAGPEKIWEALVSPAGTRALFYGSELRCDFSPGARLEYVGPGRAGPETVHMQGRLLEFDPPRRFSHSCRVGSAYGAEHANFETRVTYTLEPVGDCTLVRVLQDRWQAGDPSYENTAKGWMLVLSSLKSLMETGRPLNMTAAAHV